MKLSPGLIIVESVNTRWIIFSLQINLCGQQAGSANSGRCVPCAVVRLTSSVPSATLKKEGDAEAKVVGGNPPEVLSLGTSSKVGSFEQFFQVLAADITVVHTRKKRHEGAAWNM